MDASSLTAAALIRSRCGYRLQILLADGLEGHYCRVVTGDGCSSQGDTVLQARLANDHLASICAGGEVIAQVDAI